MLQQYIPKDSLRQSAAAVEKEEEKSNTVPKKQRSLLDDDMVMTKAISVRGHGKRAYIYTSNKRKDKERVQC